jgi:SET domain-containing protein
MEYTGELLRSTIADIRERQGAAKAIYFYALDEDWVVDATHAGNMARYINHSCK